MKFGGFTSAGEGKTVMRILKDQPLFDSMGELTEFKSETIVKIGNMRQVGGRCFLDLYTFAISKEKIVRHWTMFLGSYRFQYEIVPDKFQALIEESIEYMNSAGDCRQLRWHDLAVIMLIEKVVKPESELYSFATDRIVQLTQITNGEIITAMAQLTSEDRYRQYM
jgi:hypothetical protein